jgi:hypothetical protein
MRMARKSLTLVSVGPVIRIAECREEAVSVVVIEHVCGP